MKIAIVAGEKSGDYLGSQLIEAIKADYPTAQFVGLCGPLMQAQGATSLAEMDKISIFGLDGLLSSIVEIWLIRRRLYRHFLTMKPDVFIGIDVPDFNLGLARKLKTRGIPTVHYVSPTVWAWRPKRIKKIRRAIDLMLTLFPFEERFYQAKNVPVKYVGHPLATQVMQWQPDAALRNSLCTEAQILVAVLPGSRMSEVTRLAPVMLEAIAQLAPTRPNLRFVLPAANNKINDYLVKELNIDSKLVRILDGQSRDLLAVADMVILASGTAALEAALFAKPMIVLYKVSRLSQLVFGHTITVKHFSMPNHLTDPPVVPELIQENATAENLVGEVIRLLDDDQYRDCMRTALAEIAPALNVESGKLASQAIMQLIGRVDQGDLALQAGAPNKTEHE